MNHSETAAAAGATLSDCSLSFQREKRLSISYLLRWEEIFSESLA